MASNKHAANEDVVGRTHYLVSTLNNKKLEYMLEMMEAGIDPDTAINMRDVQMAAKWVEYNQVDCLTAAKDDESELSKNLKKIRAVQGSNVIKFIEEGE